MQPLLTPELLLPGESHTSLHFSSVTRLCHVVAESEGILGCMWSPSSHYPLAASHVVAVIHAGRLTLHGRLRCRCVARRHSAACRPTPQYQRACSKAAAGIGCSTAACSWALSWRGCRQSWGSAARSCAAPRQRQLLLRGRSLTLPF